jgi:hypothetical protein
VWGEQGIGDQILYGTLLPELIGRGQDFVCELDERLLPAFRRSFPSSTFVSPAGAVKIIPDPVDGCTAHIPLMSLAPLFRNSIEDFAAQPKRLLRADLDRRVELGYKVLPGFRVGISWRSFQNQFSIAREIIKSARLKDFEAMGERDDIQLVSLQYARHAEAQKQLDEEMAAWTGRPIHVPEVDLFRDIDGALALTAAMDVVVTNSCVTTHYAGALGVPCFLMYPGGFAPMAYWQPGPHGHQLWYPSIKNVSAPTWAECVEIVEAAL